MRHALGELTLTVPAGWQQSPEKVMIEPIESGGEFTCTFQIRSLPIVAAKRILPLIAHYQSGNFKSTPATGMVWWGEPPGQSGRDRRKIDAAAGTAWERTISIEAWRTGLTGVAKVGGTH